MKIKPNGLWFILPVSLLIVGIVVPVILFFVAVLDPVMNVTDVELNSVYEQELTAGSWISLYVEDDSILDYDVVEVNGEYYLEYSTVNGPYSVLLEITRVDSTNQDSGFYVQEFDPSSEAYTVDEFTNFADIIIEEDGTYQVIVSSFDDIRVDFGIQFSEWSDVALKMLIAIIVLVIGVLGAIVSFIVIIIMRSNNKKNLSNGPVNPHLDDSFKKQEKKEQEEIDKHFDY